MIVGLALAVGLASPGCTGSAPGSPAPRSDVERLQGKWKLVYQEMDGKKLPDEQQAEMLTVRWFLLARQVTTALISPASISSFRIGFIPMSAPKGLI